MDTLCGFNDEELQFHHQFEKIPDKDAFPMHAHEFYEIFWFLQGDGRYIVEGVEYPLDPGSIIITRPAETHKIDISQHKAYERLSLGFGTSLLWQIDPESVLTQAFDNRELGQWNLYRQHEFNTRNAYAALKGICSSGIPAHTQKLAATANLCLLLLEIYAAFGKKNDDGIANRDKAGYVIQYINAHLFEDLSLDRLCRLVYLSRSQLERVFKASTGSSVAEYIKTKRLLEARRLIRSGEPAGKTCIQCGFNDYSAFYRSYRNRFGVSPSMDL